MVKPNPRRAARPEGSKREHSEAEPNEGQQRDEASEAACAESDGRRRRDRGGELVQSREEVGTNGGQDDESNSQA